MTDTIRWINVMLAALATVAAVASAIYRWDRLTWRLRRQALSIALLLVVLGYSAAEALHRHVAGGPRVVLLAIALLLVAGAYLYRFTDDIPPRRKR